MWGLPYAGVPGRERASNQHYCLSVVAARRTAGGLPAETTDDHSGRLLT